MNPQVSDEGPRYAIVVGQRDVMRPENLEFLGRFGYTDLYRTLIYAIPLGVARANSPEAREFLKAYVQLMR